MLLKKHNLVFVKELAEQVQIQTSRKNILIFELCIWFFGEYIIFLSEIVYQYGKRILHIEYLAKKLAGQVQIFIVELWIWLFGE